MKHYNRFLISFALIFVAFTAGVNFFVYRQERHSDGRSYLVEINRLAHDIQENPDALPDVSGCEYVRSISPCMTKEEVNQASAYEVCIRRIGDTDYRFEYVTEMKSAGNIRFLFNLVAGLLFFGMLAILFYIRNKIIKPFHILEAVPYELSKGHLAISLEEEQTKYFGKFVWGLNMLSDHLQARRNKELEMHREKKTLLLSLAHDIKTPLSVIRLNTQAIEKGIYQEEEKKVQTCQKMIEKLDEIEAYLEKLMDASRDDFLDLHVNCREVSLREVMDFLAAYYEDKLRTLYTEFTIDTYADCIVRADKDRLIEVCQNVIENAIKYGDGREIHIGFAQEEDCLLIEICNTGGQLPQEELNHIFDSFYRGSNAGSQAGHGLGLCICRKLMTAMHGDIFVKEGDGVFKVTLVVPEVTVS